MCALVKPPTVDTGRVVTTYAETLGLFDISACFGGGGLIAIIVRVSDEAGSRRSGRVAQPGTPLRTEIVADQTRHALQIDARRLHCEL